MLGLHLLQNVLSWIFRRLFVFDGAADHDPLMELPGSLATHERFMRQAINMVSLLSPTPRAFRGQEKMMRPYLGPQRC